jgi:hypothetical protein
VDRFPDTLGALGRADGRDIGGVSLRVLDARDMLDHKLALFAGASAAHPVEEKHYADATRLGRICGRDVAWLPASHFTQTVFSRDTDATCLRCEVSQCAGFPLAQKRAILDVLGYV